jgi:hypothetical protein
MEAATLPTTIFPRLPLVRSLVPAAGARASEGHLHFDRAARVWRGHDEHRREGDVAQLELRECA